MAQESFCECSGQWCPLRVCVGVGGAHNSVRLEVRMRIRAQVAAGPLALHWSVAGPVDVTGAATVIVTAAPTPASS